MMKPEQALREGRLSDALTDVQERIRANPADAKQRIYLFQLLAVLGEWERALTQLQVVGELDAAALPMVHTYREAIRCEKDRSAVFSGKATPRVFGEPQRWLALLIEALRVMAEGQPDQAAMLRAEAFEMAPATSGTINGEAFEWIADADSRLGPNLEAVVNGTYFWIPFERVQELHVDPPEDMRDLVWTPARFVWANGGDAVGLIPTRYSGSEAIDDPQIRLSHRTEWLDLGGDSFAGRGQRMLATDGGEYPLLEVRLIALASAGSAAAEPPSAAEGGETAAASDAGTGS